MTDTKKVAVLSGGRGGVGRATSMALAHKDYRVVVLYRNSSEEEINAMRCVLPDETLFMPCDLRDARETAHRIHSIFSITGRIDVAVHAAVDPIKREKILAMDAETFRSQFETGFFGAFNFLQPIASLMKQQGKGTLIGITSTVIESDSTVARMGAYTVGKIALRGFLRELHREVSSTGVRVFAVAPGLMRTRLNADLPEKFFEIAEERSDGTARMTPDHVAEAIVHLCTDPEISSGISRLVSSGEHTPL